MLAEDIMAWVSVSPCQLKFRTSRHPFSGEMTPCRPSPVGCNKHTNTHMHRACVGAENTPAELLLSGWAQTAMLTRFADGGKLCRVPVAGDTVSYIIKLLSRLDISHFLTALFFLWYSFWQTDLHKNKVCSVKRAKTSSFSVCLHLSSAVWAP